MKELLQTFGYTLAIGMVVFFAVMIISKSGVGLAEKWKVNSDKLEKEADNFVKKVDKGVDNTKDFLEKVQDNRDNPTKNPNPNPVDKNQGESYNDVDAPNIVEVLVDDPTVPEVENPLQDRPTEFVNTTSSPATNQKIAPTVSMEDDDKTYQIQLGVVTKKNTDLSNFRIVNGLGDIYAQTIDNSKSRILLGDFQGKRAARLVLEEVKQRGLKDAFLVEKKQVSAAIAPTKKAVEKPIPVSNVEEIGNYIVRLGVFSEPPTEKLTKLSEIGKIYLQPHSTNPNLNIVSIGIFASKSQAEAALASAKKQSFKDAFITTANNQLIDANAGKGLYYLPDEYKNPSNACVEQYVIQLSAAKRPNVGDFKTLLNMGNLFTEYDPANDISKVFVGPFEDKANANQALQKVKAKGFQQAFVVDRTKY
ncbi:MAG: SPOR domain-containing protein [Chitinophagales bacterium]